MPLRLTRNVPGAAAKFRASADAAQAATFATTDEAFSWAKKDNRRLLHVVYRVGDIDKTIKYISLPYDNTSHQLALQTQLKQLIQCNAGSTPSAWG